MSEELLRRAEKAEENYNVLRAEHQKLISKLQVLKLDFFSLKHEYDKLIESTDGPT